MIQIAAKLPPPCRERLGTKMRICRHAICDIFNKVVAPHTDIRIPVKIRRKPLHLPADRDFIFEPVQHDLLSVCAHVVDSTMSEVLVGNDSDQAVVLPKRTRLGKLVEHEANGSHVADSDAQDLKIRPAKATKGSWIKKALTTAMAATAAFNAATTPQCEVVHSTGETLYDSGGSNATGVAGSMPALT